MKFALALLAFVAMSSAWTIPNIGHGKLAKELQDFLDILPQQEIASIIDQYAAQDSEFKAMIQYFKADDVKQLVKNVEEMPEFIELTEYMYNAGIDVHKLQEIVHNWLGLAQATFDVNKQITGGLRGCVDDLKAAIRPYKNQLDNLYNQKMQSSEVFKNFMTQLRSQNFKTLVEKVHAQPKFQELLKHAETTAKIDLNLVREILKTILGFDFPSYTIYEY